MAKGSDEYWSRQVSKYLDQDWSNKPSYFVQLVAEHLKPKSKILELGAGAGQDSLWLASQGHNVIMSDFVDSGFSAAKSRAELQGLKDISFIELDLVKPFDIPSSTLDAVYAQLVLHYFSDEVMNSIMAEIKRVLKPGGLVAIMVNSTSDDEYQPSKADEFGLIEVDGISKRYFDLKSFEPFTEGFKTIVFNDEGRTPKDDKVGNAGLIQFIGTKA